MKTIGDILTRDLSKKIEEVIQVNQVDEQSVYDELTEYVATDRIKDHYRDLLKAMAAEPSDPNAHCPSPYRASAHPPRAPSRS